MLRGGQISKRGSVFSADGRLLLVPCGQEVRVYAAATSEQCGQLVAHTAEVTSVALNPADNSQVYSVSLDGTLRLWEISTGECLQVLAVKEAVRHMVLHAGLRMAYLSIEWRDGQSGRVISFHLEKGKAGSSAMKTRAAGPLAMNPHGSLAATIDRHSLFVWRVGPEISQPLNLHHTKPYTCVAISPDESIVAAGDITGRILLWRNVGVALPHPSRSGQPSSADATGAGTSGTTGPVPVCTTLHWHAGPVGCLAFSPDSTYLRSGGREGVLVSWQLDNNQPHFLPRLGGALLGMTHCPSNPALLLLRQADNTLRVINMATNLVSASVFGIRPIPPQLAPSDTQPATTIQPGSGLLCVPAHNATLQLFDTVHNRHVALLQVLPRNEVSATNPADEGVDSCTPYVSHSAFTHDGRCLATVAVRPGAGPFGSTETNLRFWDAQTRSSSKRPGSAPFTLNTLADDPHRGPITCIAAHPTQDIFITGGGSAADTYSSQGLPGSSPAASQPEFKIWEKVYVPRRPGSKVESPSCWRCRSVGSYKGLPFTAAAFSPDGSVLALASASKVTLWDPMTSNLACVLPTPPELLMGGGHAVTQLEFLQGAPYLVGSSGHALVVWDLLSCVVHWAAPLRCSSIAADPTHPRFAVALTLPTPRPSNTLTAAPPSSSGQVNTGANGHNTEMDVDTLAAWASTGKAISAAAGVSTAGASAAGASAAGPSAAGPSAAGASAAGAGQSAAAAGSSRRHSGCSDREAGAMQPSHGEGEGEAVGVGPGRGQQSQGSQPQQQVLRSKATVCSCVLVFGPSSPLPLQAAFVHDAAHVQLLFNGNSKAADVHALNLSPLLVITETRGYGYISSGAPEEVADETAQKPPASGMPAAQVSAFEAAFGPLTQITPQQAAETAEKEGGSTELRWRQLFDAPSHVLPPPSTLATAFLRLLTSDQ